MNPLVEHRNLPTCRRFPGTAALQSLLRAQISAPLELKGPPHFAPKAKRVSYMMQAGGPLHVDFFDYKPQLDKMRAGRI